MALDVGSVVARLGARVDDDGFDRFDRRLDKARRDSRDDVEAKLKGDVDTRGFDRYERKLKDVEQASERTGRGGAVLRKGLGVAALGGAAAAGGLALAGKAAFSAVGAFEEAEKTARRQALVIRTMGQDAGASAEHVNKLAASLSMKAGVDDDTIIAGANVVRTFRNIRNEAGEGNDVFDRTTKAALDMSVALGTDLQSASIQLGKALNDPAKGAAALSRSGTIAKADLEKLKDMAKAGAPILEQQRFVLKAVEEQFQGTAASSATASGKMKVAFGELQESIGEALAPTVRRFTANVTKFINEMRTGEGAGGRFADRARAIGRALVTAGGHVLDFGRRVKDALGGALAFIRRNQTAFEVLAGAIAGVMVIRTVTRLYQAFRTALVLATLAQMRLNVAMRTNVLGIVVTVLAALAGALVTAYRRSATFRNIVDEAFRRVKSAAGDAIAFILRRLDDFLGGISSIASAMGRLPGKLGAPFRSAAGAIDGARERIRKLANEADALGRKKIKPVSVRVNLALGPGGKEYRPGDGWGLEDAVRATAQAGAAKLDVSSIIGSMGLGGAAAGGTGLTAFNHLAGRFGVTVGSGLRPGARTASGNVSMHALGRARDFPGPPAAMMRFALYLASKYGSRLKELIYTPMGFAIKNGQRVAPYAQADHYDHVHVAMRDGGKVGPKAGGLSIRVAGEGAKDEWVISQEGDRQKNIGYALDALQALGARVELNARGKGRRRGRKPPPPKLSPKANRGIRRSIQRGEAGFRDDEDGIRNLEREYDLANRRAELDDNDFLVEHDDGSVTIDQAGQRDRVAELTGLRRKRAAIKAAVERYRQRIRRAIAAYTRGINRLRRALGAAKGKARQKERAGYRQKIGDYTRRRGELSDLLPSLGYDVEDAGIDLDELTNELAAVSAGAGTKAAPAKDVEAPDAPDTPDTPAPEPAEPAAAPPDPAEVAAQALAQFAAFQSARADLFGAHGSNFAAAGTNPYAGEAGLAAGRRYFGATGGGDQATTSATPGITQNVYLTIADERDTHAFTQAALHDLRAYA